MSYVLQQGHTPKQSINWELNTQIYEPMRAILSQAATSGILEELKSLTSRKPKSPINTWSVNETDISQEKKYKWSVSIFL